MISIEKLSAYYKYLQNLKNDMYTAFADTKVVSEDMKNSFLGTLDALGGDLNDHDPLKDELKVVENTSLNDGEMIRNVDYIERVIRDTIDDLQEDGSSIWLTNGEIRSKISAVNFPRPRWLTEYSRPLWESAVNKLDTENALVYGDGEYNYKGAVANFIVLLQDELAKAEKQFNRIP